MDEIKRLMLNLGCNWIFEGDTISSHDRAVQRLLEIGKPVIPFLIDEFRRIVNNQAKRLCFSYEDMSGDEERTKSGILHVMKELGVGIVPAYSDLCIEGINEVPTGPDLIIDFKKRVRFRAFEELSEIITKCDSTEEVRQIEEELHKSLFVSNKQSSMFPHDVKMNFAKLIMKATKRKNELASKLDILLLDIPKPPKKGGMFKTLDVRLKMLGRSLNG